MKNCKNFNYDVIIIGAGIGGLVSGCYLAKSGLKVLIIEQHSKAGGYCSSFSREGFIFEVGALSSLREGTPFRNILENLDICNEGAVKRSKTAFALFTPDFKIKINNDLNEVINSLQSLFPGESRRIKVFFNLAKNASTGLLYKDYKTIIFNDYLHSLFSDKKLIAVIRTLTSQIGVPADRLSLASALFQLRESVLDGGYYFDGGLQEFSNAFVSKFIKWGGKIIFSKSVSQIIIKNNIAKAVKLDTGEMLFAKNIIANCDLTNLFINMLERGKVRKDFINKLKKKTPSVSAFLVYLGIQKNLKDVAENCHEFWHINDYHLDDPSDKKRLNNINSTPTFYCYLNSTQNRNLAPKDCESFTSFILVDPLNLNKTFWNQRKNIFSEAIIDRTEYLIPNLRKYLKIKLIATPLTLHKYTLNRGGAFRGWTLDFYQSTSNFISSRMPVEGLYAAGHWVNLPLIAGGIPAAAYTGYLASRIILDKEGKR